MPREVVVMNGIFAPDEWPKRTVQLSFDVVDKGNNAGQGGDVGSFIRAMSRKLNRPFVIEPLKPSANKPPANR